MIRNYEKPSRGDEKQEVKVIKDISFEIDEKEFVGIMGNLKRHQKSRDERSILS